MGHLSPSDQLNGLFAYSPDPVPYIFLKWRWDRGFLSSLKLFDSTRADLKEKLFSSERKGH